MDGKKTFLEECELTVVKTVIFWIVTASLYGWALIFGAFQ
jgi:hypothetical protein